MEIQQRSAYWLSLIHILRVADDGELYCRQIVVAYQWLIELDTLFCQEVVRGADRLLPQPYQFVVILFGGVCYIGNVVTFMIIYIPVIGQFCLMKYSFVDQSVSLQHLLRTFVVRLTVGSDEAEL